MAFLQGCYDWQTTHQKVGRKLFQESKQFTQLVDQGGTPMEVKNFTKKCLHTKWYT